jgi:hypothetical protein
VLVFGDRWREVVPSERCAALDDLLRRPAAGAARHDGLVRALIEAGELAQGLADAELARLGADDDTPLQAAAMRLTIVLARKVDASWRSGFADAGPDHAAPLAALASTAPVEPVRCKTAEGYAYYALYPEAFMAAARELDAAPLMVIGLRSIGTSLAAAVAAVSRGAQVVTVRPHGPPFARRLSLSQALERRLASHQGPFAVVDEGPGLSGSSFACVADALARLGVAPERIVFFPGHAGEPGPAGRAGERERWRKVRRSVRQLDDIAPPQRLAGWFDNVTGGADHVEDLSHGGWRAELPLDKRPPVWAAGERRKLRLTGPDGVFLARFAGLGRAGEEKLERARALHAAGFGAEPLALRHGFLLERWLPGEPLLEPPRDRAAMLGRLGDYLSFRLRQPAGEAFGADQAELGEMARVNAELLGGRGLADRVVGRLAALDLPADRLRPMQVDGRLHVWEWRQGPDGVLRKTDALDHCCAHDLIGCQDIGWDLAGAGVEFALSEPEARALERRVLGHEDPVRTDCFRGLYCAFQAGAWWMAARAAEGEDRERAARQRDAYAARLRQWAADDA